nr:CASP-like protein 5B1 [Ipomoea batatas]
MGLQVLWSFALACLDAHALRMKRDMHTHVLVTATLSLAAACSSAGVMVLFGRDTTICQRMEGLSCPMFQVSISLAFLSWFLLAFSSYVMFWLAASN